MSAPPTARQPATVDRPLTRELRAIVRREVWRDRVATVSYAASLGLAGLGATPILTPVVIAWLVREWQWWREGRASQYAETTGPVRTSTRWLGLIWRLELAGRKIEVMSALGAPAWHSVPQLPSAVVEHTKQRHFVLEIRGPDGELLYRPPRSDFVSSSRAAVVWLRDALRRRLPVWSAKARPAAGEAPQRPSPWTLAFYPLLLLGLLSVQFTESVGLVGGFGLLALYAYAKSAPGASTFPRLSQAGILLWAFASLAIGIGEVASAAR